MAADREIICSNPECKCVMGKKIIIDNFEWLQVGGVILREARGVCANCKQGFYYSVSDRMMESLLAKAIKPN